MTIKESMQLPLGLYRIFWKSGGSSLASIGMLENGRRWIAPCNWVTPAIDSEADRVWRDVKSVLLIIG